MEPGYISSHQAQLGRDAAVRHDCALPVYEPPNPVRGGASLKGGMGAVEAWRQGVPPHTSEINCASPYRAAAGTQGMPANGAGKAEANARRQTARPGRHSKGGSRAKSTSNHICQGCQATTTPEWRKGPTGPRTLCNACGLLYAKMCRKREQDAVASAVAHSEDPAEARRKLAEEQARPERQGEALESLRAGVRVFATVKQHRMGVNARGAPAGAAKSGVAS
ncbi:hypothetical protein MSPP1_001654 [Malassezia sp. CBS 17886]|nr:hypothetical protein MSPP1_001654 [Malassezia sp. CBS 17886]